MDMTGVNFNIRVNHLNFLDIIVNLFWLPKLLVPIDSAFKKVVVIIVLAESLQIKEMFPILFFLLFSVASGNAQLTRIVINSFLARWSSFE